jgi:hypothetical protein
MHSSVQRHQADHSEWVTSIGCTAVMMDRRRDTRAVHHGSIQMSQTIGAILGQAVGVAISPLPIIAVILMLFSKGSKVEVGSPP